MITAEDEREVLALVERIENDLITVLERHAHQQTEAGHGARSNRWIALHSVVDLAGRLAQSAIAEEGEEARPTIMTMVQQLEMLVAPANRRLN
jgi:hypothetical protein